MKTLVNAMILSRGQFVREMASGVFVRYTLHKSGKSIQLVAQDKQGSQFTLGTSAGHARLWTDMNNPTRFLIDCNVHNFCVEIEGDSN